MAPRALDRTRWTEATKHNFALLSHLLHALVRDSGVLAFMPIIKPHSRGEAYELATAVSSNKHWWILQDHDLQLDISAIMLIPGLLEHDHARISTCKWYFENSGDEMLFDQHVAKLLDLSKSRRVLTSPEAYQSLKTCSVLTSRNKSMK